jgi:hypothetical protein
VAIATKENMMSELINIEDIQTVLSYKPYLEDLLNLAESYGSDNDAGEAARNTPAIVQLIYFWEKFLYPYASHFSSNYQGGFWIFKNGFFQLQSSHQFHVSVSGNYFEDEMSCLEFSFFVNLMTLSHLSLQLDAINNNRNAMPSNVLRLVIYAYHRLHCLMRLNKKKVDVCKVLRALD